MSKAFQIDNSYAGIDLKSNFNFIAKGCNYIKERFKLKYYLISRQGSDWGSYADRLYQYRVLLLWKYHGSFLTRLVQNLTIRNDCNLIPSPHGTQRVVLSKRLLGIHFTETFPNQRSVPSSEVMWLTMHSFRHELWLVETGLNQWPLGPRTFALTDTPQGHRMTENYRQKINQQ